MLKETTFRKLFPRTLTFREQEIGKELNSYHITRDQKKDAINPGIDGGSPSLDQFPIRRIGEALGEEAVGLHIGEDGGQIGGAREGALLVGEAVPHQRPQHPRPQPVVVHALQKVRDRHWTRRRAQDRIQERGIRVVLFPGLKKPEGAAAVRVED